MNQERIYIIAMILLAVLASIPQIPVDAQIFAALLALVGIVAGVLVHYDVAQRTLIYVLAVALPVFSNGLDAIWVVGPWVNTLFDHLATGVQGLAVGVLVMALLARIQGTHAAAH
ncbi:MAG TPA: hypothetical protein VLD39_18435 [Gammaproteobacteria bacterium]|nr:hypothetical protein [Gammaproteobacteria bacterium]